MVTIVKKNLQQRDPPICMESTIADALYVSGICLHWEYCVEKVVQVFVQALRMTPGHEKACVACKNANALKQKKEDGNKAFKEGNYKLAYELSTEVLRVYTSNNIKMKAKLYCNPKTGTWMMQWKTAQMQCSSVTHTQKPI